MGLYCLKAIFFPNFFSQIREKIRCYCNSGSNLSNLALFLPARQRFILSRIGKSLILIVCLSLSMIHHLPLFFHKWFYSFIMILGKPELCPSYPSCLTTIL